MKLINDNWQNTASSIEDNHFDWVIADPPYFQGPNKRKFYGRRVSNNNVKRKDYQTIESWAIPTLEDYNELCRISKNQIIFGINYFHEFNNLVGSGRIVWDKCNGESSFSDCEIASISSIDSVRLIPFMWNGMLQGKSIKDGRSQKGNKKMNEKKIHPTQKPVDLYAWLLSTFCKTGQKILDPYAGSMSSVIACDSLGFDITAVEADKKMFEMASLRVETHKKQLKLF